MSAVVGVNDLERLTDPCARTPVTEMEADLWHAESLFDQFVDALWAADWLAAEDAATELADALREALRAGRRAAVWLPALASRIGQHPSAAPFEAM